MISGREAHVARHAERGEPVLGEGDFARKSDVDDIAGHDDMVRRLRLDIGDDPGEHAHVVLSAALIEPVHIARDALAEKLGEIWPRNGTDMGVGQMSQSKIQENLMSLHARSTAALSARMGWRFVEPSQIVCHSFGIRRQH